MLFTQQEWMLPAGILEFCNRKAQGLKESFFTVALCHANVMLLSEWLWFIRVLSPKKQTLKSMQRDFEESYLVTNNLCLLVSNVNF